MSGYPFTQEQDALIQAIWSTTSMKARRDATAKLFPKLLKHGLSRDIAYQRAVALGCLYPLNTKGAPWTEAELAILDASAHCPIATIRGRLRRRGYARSMAAIVKQRLERSGTRADARLSAGVYSATQAAELIGSHSNLVVSYIRRGWLRAKQIELGWGKHEYRIKAADLRQFVVHHTAYVNIERVDKYAFIDMLFPQHGEKGASQAKAIGAPVHEYTEAA